MTLIISILSPKIIAHASDTRHTWLDPVSKKVVRKEDGKIKSIIVQGRNCHYIVSYCGLGAIGKKQQRTDRWLVDVLTSIGAGKISMGETIGQLKEVLSSSVKSAREVDKLSVIISGVDIVDGKFNIKHYIISNFEHPKGKHLVPGNIGEFQIFHPNSITNKPVNGPIMIVDGAEFAMNKALVSSRIKKLKKITVKWRPSKSEDFIQSLAQLIRLAADDKRSGYLISKSSIVTTMPLDIWDPVATYFNNEMHHENYGPHIIGPNVSIRDVSFSGPEGTSIQLNTW